MVDREIKSIADKYLDFVTAGKYKIVKAYIFGSYARGNFNADSDIDIAIIFDKIADRFDMRVDLMKIGRKVDLRIEPHPFGKADIKENNPFLLEVMNKGIQIYG